MTIENLKSDVIESLGALVQSAQIKYGQLTITVDPAMVLKVLVCLRDTSRCQFTQLVDICGVDYPGRSARFDVVYHLLSLKFNTRLRLKIAVQEGESVPSAVDIYSVAGWLEREVWDMYGIPFEGHADLRRILTDYGFEGHPLRKDFPLTGLVEVRYSEDQKRVAYEPVQLQQTFRTFDFLSPWEGNVPATLWPASSTNVNEVPNDVPAVPTPNEFPK